MQRARVAAGNDGPGAEFARLDLRQSAKIITAAVEQAGRHGVTRSDIAALAPRALKPGRSDLRAGLGRL